MLTYADATFINDGIARRTERQPFGRDKGNCSPQGRREIADQRRDLVCLRIKREMTGVKRNANSFHPEIAFIQRSGP
jgi:hypothetical protein